MHRADCANSKMDCISCACSFVTAGLLETRRVLKSLARMLGSKSVVPSLGSAMICEAAPAEKIVLAWLREQFEQQRSSF